MAETTSPYSVLVVDDNILIRSVLQDLLKEEGYEVVTSENGKDALRKYRSHLFQIIISDWVMPEMNGLELCRAIREESHQHGYTYFILLTSQDSKNDIIAGLQAGADEYLIKPVHKPELHARLNTARRILELEAIRERYVEEARSVSLVDPLTGVNNRRFMDERLFLELKRSYRYKRSLSVILIGFNRFEDFRREYGYHATEQLLKSSASTLDEAIRKEIDWIARYTEDTFIVMLPETSSDDALIVATRFRLRIKQLSIKVQEESLNVTGLFGVAGFAASDLEQLELTAEALVDHAVKMLAVANTANPIRGIKIT
jgi:diguanylate cyclase (GGDEF)-like protein